MKRVLSVVMGVALALSAGQAGAFTHFTQDEFMTADSLDPGMTQSGIHFTLSDRYKSYYPEIRYGMGGLLEVGVKFGMVTNIKPGDLNGALGGLDLKYQLVKQAEGIPVDMAVDLGFDTTVISGTNVSELKFSTIFSRGYPLTDRGYKFTPYGGLQLSALYGSYLPESDTKYYVFGGIEWKLSQKFMVLLEVKTGPSTVGGAVIRFEY